MKNMKNKLNENNEGRFKTTKSRMTTENYQK